MSDRQSSPPPTAVPRARRSHAERTAETRARVVAAVVESIAEVGFQRTTAAEIARRAGVTWGAVQHHFGGKNGILLAVLEDSFDRFAERLDEVRADAPLDERVAQFVDRAWEHFGSPHYHSTFEILLNHDAQAAESEEPSWQEEMLTSWNRVWQRLFGDARLSKRDTVALQQFTISLLSGMASLKMLDPLTSRSRRAELELLKHTLSRELSRTNGA